MDCEGTEFELPDPKRDPSLVAADIIVEIHEGLGDTRLSWPNGLP